MARNDGRAQAFNLSSDNCPITAAVDLIGDRWTWLILRGAMLGLCHFEEFQACLGIARNILSDRLAKMVAADILARTPDPNDRRRVNYSLTKRGSGLLPVLVALRQWGLDAGLGTPAHPTLADRKDRKPVARMTVRAHDGRALGLRDLVWIAREDQEVGLRRPQDTGMAAA